MKSTEYIEWDKLEQIPFCLCRIAEDEENQEIDVYYLDKRVCHDYDHIIDNNSETIRNAVSEKLSHLTSGTED